jgi:hypothetical protein
MNDEIEPIILPIIPFNPEDKIFQNYDDETGEPIGKPYSLKEWCQTGKSISGINPDLLGKNG